MHDSDQRLTATLAFAGAVLLGLGTSMHPMEADPNNTVAAFTEYAAAPRWVTSHLIQFAGVAGMMAALLLLARQLETAGGALARIGAAGATASLAIAAALQAVDGIALKAMVDAWAAAPAAEKEAAFHAAFAVRQVEAGLAALLMITIGLTALAYGAALRRDGSYPAWLSGIAFAGGAAMTAAGMVTAYTGFSPLTMRIQMPASLLLLAWMTGLGAILWRRAERGAG
jgi:hypothetical protein